MSSLHEVVGMEVVRDEGAMRKRRGSDERKQVPEILGLRAFANQNVHPGAQLFPRLFEIRALVVGADARRQVGIEGPSRKQRRMAIAEAIGKKKDLLQYVREAGRGARVVHHLGQAENPFFVLEGGKVGGAQFRTGSLQGGRGNAGGHHEEEIHGKSARGAQHPADAVGAQHVRNLVGIGDDRRRPVGQRRPRQFRGRQHAAFDVEVPVDKAGTDKSARSIDDLASLVPAEADDPSAGNRNVGFEDLLGEDIEDAAAADDEFRRNFPAGRLQAPLKLLQFRHRNLLQRVPPAPCPGSDTCSLGF